MDFTNQFLLFWAGIALLAFFTLFFKNAPYGRFTTSSWGRDIPSRLGWILMESPSVLVMLVFVFLLDVSIELVPAIFIGIWLLHYTHRTFIWPFRAQIKYKRMPLIVAIMGFIFNVINASIQAFWIIRITTYDISWLYSFPFIIGLLMFFVGMYINVSSDNILMSLRKNNGNGYHIPHGFLFNKVTSPNYFGEIIEWLGWAIMTWNLAGLLFFLWTFANLFPRALSNHKWYKEKFEDYPEERKIIFPNLY